MAKRPTNFDNNVFINCPFDEIYTPLFNAIVFTVQDVGFLPRCALEASNAGQVRLHKILDIIEQCKFSIHDLSRTEIDPDTNLPRFNMPLELGLDLGCKRFGTVNQKEKVVLILDVERYRYQMFISDIAGQDIAAHGGDIKTVIRVVRDWFRPEIDPKKVIMPGGTKIAKRYEKFSAALPALCSKKDLDSKRLPFTDFSYLVAFWIEANPL